MTDLERRAPLGDREAQEECTRRGIVMPCVHGAECRVFDMKVDGKTVYRVISMNCCCCFQGPMYFTEKEALAHWNTRPAPPIGRCGECKHWGGIDEYGDGYCKNPEGIDDIAKETDFCSRFEPKGDEKNVNHETLPSVQGLKDHECSGLVEE